MNLTTAQEQAIFHKDGPALVLAGPGSGKTFVITQRIKTLIEAYHIPPEQILVISFTRAAAAEMKERFLKLINQPQTQTVFGTFHSIFFTILRNSYSYSGNCIITEKEKLFLLRKLTARYLPEGEEKETFLTLFLQEFQKGEDLSHFSRAEYQQIYKSYIQWLNQEKRLDFDQILIRCYELLKKHPDILRYWQQRFPYVLIDEFQDINQLQFKIIQLLASPENNLFVVGDDDQSIYGFRGSKPDIMLKFPELYPDCNQILLDKNFRCSQTITEHSKSLISNNQIRFSKEISPFRKEEGQIFIQQFETQQPECQFIVKSILQAVSSGMSYTDIAILFRIHSGTRNLITALHRANIPFLLKDKFPNIFDHWICQDILCYLRLAHHKGSRQDFIKIMEKPFQGIYRSDLTLEWNPLDLRLNFEESDKKRSPSFETFCHNMDFIETLSPYLAVSYIQNSIGYEKYLKQHAIKEDIAFQDLWSVFEEFKEFAKESETYEELLERIDEQTALLNQKPTNSFDGISLMSFHSSKGLEFKRVYLIDCNENITPYKKATADAEIEEERRMFYVAVTRAKDELYICYLERLYNKKLVVSRFVEEF